MKYNIDDELTGFFNAAFPTLSPKSPQAKDIRLIWYSATLSFWRALMDAADETDEYGMELLSEVDEQLKEFKKEEIDPLRNNPLNK